MQKDSRNQIRAFTKKGFVDFKEGAKESGRKMLYRSVYYGDHVIIEAKEDIKAGELIRIDFVKPKRGVMKLGFSARTAFGFLFERRPREKESKEEDKNK